MSAKRKTLPAFTTAYHIQVDIIAVCHVSLRGACQPPALRLGKLIRIVAVLVVDGVASGT